MVSYNQTLALACSFLLALPGPTLANASVSDEIIVTATRTAGVAEQSLSAISIFDAHEIERYQSNDLFELLTRAPGIDIVRNGGKGSITSLFLRGTGSDQTLILLDGNRINSASSGEVALQFIPIQQIERIEIVRGPRASLYGSDAMGGVIQIFTHKESDVFTPRFKLAAGTESSSEASLSLSGAFGQTQYNAGISYFDTAGINRTVGDNPGNADEDAYDNAAVNIGLKHTLNSGSNIFFNSLQSKGTTYIDIGSIEDRTDFSIQSINFGTELTLSEHWTSLFSFGNAKDKGETLGMFPSTFNTTRDSASWQNDFSINSEQMLTFGIDYYNDEIDSTATFVQTERDNTAAFVQYQYNSDKHDISFALRQDDNEAYGKNTTKNIAWGIDTSEKTRLIASYGTAFNAPTFNDLFFPVSIYGGFPGPNDEYIFGGNPNLIPEESETFEVGIQISSEHHRWGLNLFDTNIDNLIATATTFINNNQGGVTTAAIPGNINKASITGIETSYFRSLNEWELNIALTLLDPKDEHTDLILPRRAKKTMSIDLDRDFGKFSLGARWLAQGARYDDVANSVKVAGYGTVDIRGHYQINKTMQLALHINNLFDKEYYLIDGFNTQGLNALISLSYTPTN